MSASSRSASTGTGYFASAKPWAATPASSPAARPVVPATKCSNKRSRTFVPNMLRRSYISANEVRAGESSS